jgi:hypothetical protein
MGKQHGSSVRSVQVEDEEGNTEVFSTWEEVHEAIWSNIHWKQFYLAKTNPICNSPLREIFGYDADREAGEEVLAGTFEYGEDFEEATHDFFHEVALIWEIVPKDLIEEIEWKGDWEVFWKNAKEETSSSESGLHFSHYKAGAGLPLIFRFHAKKNLVMLKTGFGYKRWARGLLVMLEKIPGCQLISKLRPVLLMEAEFNCINKILFGYRLLWKVR